MITNEQEKEITLYLLGKNLPMDLVLEVKDHMIEQIESMDNVEFNEAFEKVKFLWRDELRMVYSLRYGLIYDITNFQNKIGKKIHWNILLKSIFILFIYLAFVFMIGRNSFQILTRFISLSYYTCIIVTILVLFFYFDITKKTFYVTRSKINIFQKGTSIFFVGGLYILLFNNLIFNKIKFIYSTYRLFHFEISLKIVSETVFNFVYLFMWIFGLLYFIKYKKSIKKLQKRINLKL